ncbi:MAG: hypothetical protein JJV98_05170 [Desulfosarcina sp.]|nr:hypothetical protein [Desulfobacterales bacterium]
MAGLRHHMKMREGFSQRMLAEPFRHPTDIWIQAASAGESHLAGMLMERLAREDDFRILATTNTRQGLDILAATAARLRKKGPGSGIQTRFFPFDRPAIMRRAVHNLQPRLMVLLETELWPGLIYTLRQAGIPILMLNARLQARSLKTYRLWPGLWRHLSPDRILAVSRADAGRLERLFDRCPVEIMPNMKFDRMALPPDSGPAAQPLAWTRHLPPDSPFVVLGSIRREEEIVVAKMIAHLLQRRPDLVVGLYPRHMHRIEPWRRRLQSIGIRYWLRSRIDRDVKKGTVIIGDIFGELVQTYPLTAGVFVGGSLAPLGGHNFLEPLLGGIAAVIGPYRQAFEWVGPDLFRDNLVHVATDWRAAARLLLNELSAAGPKNDIQRRAAAFFERHRGGTKQACLAIREILTGT